MANDLLQTLLQRAVTPLVPEGVIEPTVNTLTEPRLTQSPMTARIKGFGAGILEGLRDQTSPINLLSAMTIPASARVVAKNLMRVKQVAQAVPSLIQTSSRAMKQVMPEADDVTKLAHQLRQRLTQVPTSRKLAPTLPGEFTHTGNVKPNPDLAKIAYEGSKDAVGASPTRRILEEQKYLMSKKLGG